MKGDEPAGLATMVNLSSCRADFGELPPGQDAEPARGEGGNPVVDRFLYRKTTHNVV